MKFAVVVVVKVPIVTGTVTLPAWNDELTPVNATVAVPPDVNVMELVPEPVHARTEPQVNRPLLLIDTSNTTLPSGRTVKGSAYAVVEVAKRRNANGNSRTNLAILPLL